MDTLFATRNTYTEPPDASRAALAASIRKRGLLLLSVLDTLVELKEMKAKADPKASESDGLKTDSPPLAAPSPAISMP